MRHNADRRESSDSLFKQLNWLTVFDEIEIRKCCLIYKRINGLKLQIIYIVC